MAEDRELTDSQLLEVARQLEQELRFKKHAAAALKQFVQNKQKFQRSAHDAAHLDEAIAANRMLLEQAILAHQARLVELDNEFAAKKAEKQKGLESLSAGLLADIEGLKRNVALQAEAVAAAEKDGREAIKQADAAYKSRVAALNKSEADKIARNDALDKEFTNLQKSLDELKERHGLK